MMKFPDRNSKASIRLFTVPSEDKEHANFVEYLEKYRSGILFRVGAEAGKRNPAKTRKLGIRSGWPDFEFFLESKEYRGLWIELKRKDEELFKKNGKPKDERIANQIMMIDRLRKQGYKAEFAFGAKQAIEIFETYLKGAY